MDSTVTLCNFLKYLGVQLYNFSAINDVISAIGTTVNCTQKFVSLDFRECWFQHKTREIIVMFHHGKEGKS